MFGAIALAVVVFMSSRVIAGQPFQFLPDGSTLPDVLSGVTLVRTETMPINIVVWSMRWEVWFSIILPPLLVLLAALGCGPRRRFTHTPLLFGGLCLAMVIGAPIIRLTYDTPPLWNRVLLYLPMFGIGMAIAAYEPHLQRLRQRRSMLIGGAILTLAIAAHALKAPLTVLDRHLVYDHRYLLAAQHSAVIVAVIGFMITTLSWGPAISQLSGRVVQWLGIRSYSLYLTHLPILFAIKRIGQVDGCPVWFPLVVVAVGLAVASGFYRLVEQPSIHLSQRFGRSRRTPAPAPVSAQPERVLEPVG